MFSSLYLPGERLGFPWYCFCSGEVTAWKTFLGMCLKKKLIMDVCGAVECGPLIKGEKKKSFVIFELIFGEEVNLM